MKIATFWVVKRAVWYEVSTISENLTASIISISVSVLHSEDGGGTRVISVRKSVLSLSDVNVRRGLISSKRFYSAIKETM
jgi:ribonuclease PH